MAARDERRPHARIATLGAFMVVAAFVAGKAARDAILLTHFEVRWLPLFIGTAAALSFPAIVVAGRLMTRFGPARLIPLLNAISAAFAVIEWLLFGRYPKVIAVAVFLHLTTASAVLVSGFWSIVNERFDVQSAKHHIGRIGVGATIGGVFGGLLAERTAVYFPIDTILLVLAGLQLVCAVTLYGFGRRAHQAPVELASGQTWTALRHAAKTPLLRNIGSIVVLAAVAAGLIDYVFKSDLVAGGEREHLLRVLAVFYTVTNVLTAILQLAVCGPIIARLGVPRSVATLPLTVTACGILALAVPIPLAAAFARASEMVTRNSLYRSSYELLYAPLPEERKRSTKVVLDVGADKIGDILGAQLVSVIVLLAFDVRTMLLIAVVMVGVLATVSAMRLPNNYTQALEDNLLGHAADIAAGVPARPEPWHLFAGLPHLGHPGVVPVRSRARRARAPTPSAVRLNHGWHDPVLGMIADLRSADPAHVRHALGRPLAPELAGSVVELVGREDVGRDAITALVRLAPMCTGVLADALLDRRRSPALRRRIPAVLVCGEPTLAGWALWKSLSDPDFDIRYRSGAMLAKLAADGQLDQISHHDVFATVRRELVADPSEWQARHLVDEPHEGEHDGRMPSNLEHVFRVLGLVLPAEPMRIALHAMQTDDPVLRGTALEYLETILPPDVRAQLWPFLEASLASTPSIRRSVDELLAELGDSYAAVLLRLKQRRTS